MNTKNAIKKIKRDLLNDPDFFASLEKTREETALEEAKLRIQQINNNNQVLSMDIEKAPLYSKRPGLVWNPYTHRWMKDPSREQHVDTERKKVNKALEKFQFWIKNQEEYSDFDISQEQAKREGKGDARKDELLGEIYEYRQEWDKLEKNTPEVDEVPNRYKLAKQIRDPYAVATSRVKEMGYKDFSEGSPGQEKRDEIAEALKKKSENIKKHITPKPHPHGRKGPKSPTFTDNGRPTKKEQKWLKTIPFMKSEKFFSFLSKEYNIKIEKIT